MVALDPSPTGAVSPADSIWRVQRAVSASSSGGPAIHRASAPRVAPPLQSETPSLAIVTWSSVLLSEAEIEPCVGGSRLTCHAAAMASLSLSAVRAIQ